MDAHIRKVYVPMTETGFYILLCLREECHGYGIVQRVEALTPEIMALGGGKGSSLGTGGMATKLTAARRARYGSLSKMEKDGLICFVREEEKRKIYRITELGSQVLALEMKRIERLYRNMMEVRGHEGS